jgi:hypothetical protein
MRPVTAWWCSIRVGGKGMAVGSSWGASWWRPWWGAVVVEVARVVVEDLLGVAAVEEQDFVCAFFSY